MRRQTDGVQTPATEQFQRGCWGESGSGATRRPIDAGTRVRQRLTDEWPLTWRVAGHDMSKSPVVGWGIGCRKRGAPGFFAGCLVVDSYSVYQ
jgi:hypothetical protein